MAASPWRPFPPLANVPTIDYPSHGQQIWVRMRGWTRRPFRAIWHDGSEMNPAVPPQIPFAVAADDAFAEIPTFVVWWHELDAWQPVI